MTDWNDCCNQDYRRFHHGKKPELPKSQWRCINTRVHPDLYQRMYRLAGKAGDSLTDWVHEAIRWRVERDEKAG